MKKSNSKHALEPNSKKTIRLKPELRDAIENFISYPETKRLNRNLRRILLLYLTYDNDTLPLDFGDFMNDLYFLHEFLDKIEDVSYEVV